MHKVCIVIFNWKQTQITDVPAYKIAYFNNEKYNLYIFTQQYVAVLHSWFIVYSNTVGGGDDIYRSDNLRIYIMAYVSELYIV